MKKRLKLQAALLAVIAHSSYADDTCLPKDVGSKSPLEVFQCFEAKLNRQQEQMGKLAAENQRQQNLLDSQQKRIAELAAANQKQQKQIAELGKANERLQREGKVGIGTTNPSKLLDVAGDARIGKTNARHYLEIASQSWPEIRWTTPTYTADMRIGMAHADNSHHRVSNGDWYVYSPATGRMDIIMHRKGGVSLASKGGKVGIGTTNPSKLLEVAGDARIGKTNARHYLEIASQSWPEIRWTTPTYTADMRIGMAHADNSHHRVSNGDWYVYSPATGRMDIIMHRKGGVSLASKGGKVGIGTTTPTEKLEINGNVKANAFKTGDIFFEKDGQTLWQMFEDEYGLYVKHLKTGETYRFVLKKVSDIDYMGRFF
jgi:hypothetical protein